MNITIKGRLDRLTEDVDLDITVRPGAEVLIDGEDVTIVLQRIKDLEDELEDLKYDLKEAKRAIHNQPDDEE
jgi:hypothetical protein